MRQLHFLNHSDSDLLSARLVVQSAELRRFFYFGVERRVGSAAVDVKDSVEKDARKVTYENS